MSNFKNSGIIKIIVLIGYIVLFILAILGLYQINRQWVKFSEFQKPHKENKELNLVSNALVTLYKSESIRKVILSNDIYSTSSFRASYENISEKAALYIDSLYAITDDNHIRLSIDTVKLLLSKKDENFSGMIALMDSIRNLPNSRILKTSVLSRENINELNKIIKDKLVSTRDTSYYVKEKRKFIDRVKAIFSAKQDSTKIVSSQSTTSQDSAYIKPAAVVTDTIVQYFNDASAKSNKRKVAYITMLTSRQNNMLYYDQMFTDQINTILRGIESKEKEITAKLADEKATTLKKSSNIVSNIGLASLLAVIVFITLTFMLINKSQKYRKQLEKSKKIAEDLSKSRERLLLTISHDVKSPLSSIMGHIELLSHENLSDSEREHLNNMRHSSEQILGLSKKLLDYHRLEQGKSEINNVPFSLHQLIDDIYKSFLPAAAKKNLFIRLSNEIDETALYESDPLLFKQIFNNLISNAIKFTESGSIYLNFTFDKNINRLSASIKDTGVGINDDDKKKIFNDFSRVGTTESKEQIEGAGLGLAITKKIVELLKGKISFISEPKKGTEFIISIPLTYLGEKTSDEANKVQVNSDLRDRIDANVLFVDDDVVMLNVYSKLFEREGAKVTTCSESKNVLSLLQEKQFDIIFTDIQMPNINGFELVKKIRLVGGNYSEVPIIALSASSDATNEEFVEAGFTNFLPKPVSFDMLLNIVQQVKKSEFYNNGIANKSEKNMDYDTEKGISSLVHFIEDDREASVEVLTTFVEENRQKMELFKKALDTNDWTSVKSAAHKLLPLMRMIHADEIVEILIPIENGEQDVEKLKRLNLLIEIKNKEVFEYINKKFIQN